MRVHFDGTAEEFTLVFRSDGNAPDEVLNNLNTLKEMIMAQSIELGKLNELTNKLAQVVSDVIAADQAEDAAFQQQIDDLREQLAAAGVQNAAINTLLTEMEQGVGEVNPRLQAVVDALEATGASSTDPLPEPDIPPVE